MDYKIIDSRVRKLCAAINRLPNLWTCESCGGHEKLEIISQLPAGYFNVSFDIDDENRLPTWEGWCSLSVIERAIAIAEVKYEDEESYIKKQKDNPFYARYKLSMFNWDFELDAEILPEGNAFRIEGYDGADPDYLAQIINDLRRRVKIR